MGIARVGGGYVAPLDSTRNLFPGGMKKGSIGNASQSRSLS